ncbi:unnamed protein product [Orchesella dallaii]|uniref:C2H2-type domain-containing protein n=1 Tax=Orchesella dallaii TaxID=48710 RepID=A0ABP1RBJ3_9HEXA
MANITLGQQCKGKKRLVDHPVQAAKLRVLKKVIDRKCYSRKKLCSETARSTTRPKATPSTTASSRTSSDKELDKDTNNNTVNCDSIKEYFLSAERLLNECQEGKGVLVKEVADNVKPYERLMLSLQSPLPNEHEFAINICMVLSAEETKEFNVIAKEPALLNMLLAHVGFYHDCGLRMLMEETFREAMGKDLASFWDDIISPRKKNLLCECYSRSSRTNSEVEQGIMIELDKGEAVHLKCCGGCRYYKRENNFCDDDFDLLPKSYYCPCDNVGKRVEQVGQVLRNFSFDQGNAKVMANSGTMIRFLLASVYSDFSNVPQIGFDIISNISSFLITNQEGGVDLDELISELFELILTTVMKSNDRFKIIRSLEVLQLSLRRVENWEILLDGMDQQLYRRILDLLTLSTDTILVINCIECIFAITQMGADACGAIVSVHGWVEILVSYITGDFNGCSSLDFKFTVLKAKELQKESGRMDVSQQHQSITMREKSLKVPVPLSDFYMFNERSIMPTVVPLEPFTVHPIYQRYHMVQLQKLVTAMAKKNPSDDLAEQIISVKNVISGNLTTRHAILPSFNGLANRNSNLEQKSLETENGKQRSVTLPLTDPPTVVTKKLLSEDELDNVIPYLCEWGNCKLRFLEKKQLRWHFQMNHCPNPRNGFLEKMHCQWRGNKSSTSISCQLPRSIFSLMKHLEEAHYSDTALETALHKRLNKMEPSVTNVAASNISKDLNVVQNAQVYSITTAPIETISEKEDDVTKSIRLTAALTLRNLAKDSLDARRSLKRHESHFVVVATRGLECSSTISQLLYYLNE